MLLREVFGWLRYCLQHDVVCLANGIVVEEIASSFLSQMDVNDGPRTLAIYRMDKGYTPRIEIRFTGERPQCWWIGSENGDEHGTYLLSPYSSKFPGDFRSWSRTQFVCYLIDLARTKLCNDTVAFLTLIPPAVEGSSTLVEAMKPAKLKFDLFMRIVNSAKNSLKKGTRLTSRKVEEFITQNSDIQKMNVGIEIAKACGYYLHAESTKFTVRELNDLVEALAKGGMDISTPLCSELSDPILEKHLTQEWLDKINECASPQAKELQEQTNASVSDKIKEIVAVRNAGQDLAGTDVIFGEQVEAAIKSGGIPVPYLSLLEKADYKESIAPWSLVRRTIMAYEVPKDNQASIEDSIVEWLDHSHLIQALYKSDDDALKDLVKRKVQTFASKTVGNPNWVKEICNEVVGLTGEHDKAKALQSEFDMWLLQALSPSVSASKLPLSPHAYNTGKQDEDLYNKVFGSWLYALKTSASERRETSIKNLSHSLEHFYKQVVSDWHKDDSLEEYSPRMPNIKEIMGAATKGDKDKLFGLLVADVEDEVGNKVPDEIKAALTDGPYFNSIYKEIRLPEREAMSFLKQVNAKISPAHQHLSAEEIRDAQKAGLNLDEIDKPKKSKKVTLILTLTVTYDTNGVPVSELKSMLEDIAQNASGEGLMTGDTEAEVDTWKAKVTKK